MVLCVHPKESLSPDMASTRTGVDVASVGDSTGAIAQM
jgi:hypothetical protein